ncbi:MAG: hypothetical protein ACW99U_19975 [Candidatus Thorarchaeota archaeon]
MGKIKTIILAYIVLGVIFVAANVLGYVSMDIGGAFNVLYIIFMPIMFVYQMLMAVVYGIFGGAVPFS